MTVILGSSSKPPCSITTGKINRNSQLPSQVGSPHFLSHCPHSSWLFSSFHSLLPLLFLPAFTPRPWLFPSTHCQAAQGVAGRRFAPAHLLQEICHHSTAPPTLPDSWKLRVPCVLPAYIPGLSLLPHLTHPSCHTTLSSGISFHAQLPQDHLLPRIFFLKGYYPKPCKPQVTFHMSNSKKFSFRRAFLLLFCM